MGAMDDMGDGGKNGIKSIEPYSNNVLINFLSTTPTSLRIVAVSTTSMRLIIVKPLESTTSVKVRK